MEEFKSKAVLAAERTAEKFVRDFMVIFAGLMAEWAMSGDTINWQVLYASVGLAAFRTARDIIPAMYKEYFGKDINE